LNLRSRHPQILRLVPRLVTIRHQNVQLFHDLATALVDWNRVELQGPGNLGVSEQRPHGSLGYQTPAEFAAAAGGR